MPTNLFHSSVLLLLSLAVAASSPDDVTCLLQAPTSTHLVKRRVEKMPSSAAVSPPSSSLESSHVDRWIVDQLVGVITFCSSTSAIILLQFIVVVSMTIQVMKMTRHRIKSAQPSAGHTGGGYAASLKIIFQQYGPEICGLVACLSVALILQTQGSMATIKNALEETVVRDLARRWPTLLTADSLLGVQSMLRFLVLVSSVLRKGDGPTLLTGEVAAIFCAAALGRTVLVARSRIYMLDGPLGGGLPAALDLFSVPLLAVLARGINRRSLMASALVMIAAACVGSQNRLALAGDVFSDGLFIFVHTAELFAAFAYLFRGLLSDVVGRRSVALGFAHVMMPIQQCLSAYYFVETFRVFGPNEVWRAFPGSTGYPSEILRVGGVAQVLAYAGAAVLHYFAQYREPPTKERYLFTEVPNGLSPKVATPGGDTRVGNHVAAMLGDS